MTFKRDRIMSLIAGDRSLTIFTVVAIGVSNNQLIVGAKHSGDN